MVKKVNFMIIVKLQHSVSDLSNTLTIEAPQHSVSIFLLRIVLRV